MSRQETFVSRSRSLVFVVILAIILVALVAIAPLLETNRSNQQKGSQESQSSGQPSSSEDRTATYTLYLAVGTFVLAIGSLWQISLLKAAEKTSQAIAKAAQTAADAALSSLDRPWLIVEGLELNEFDWFDCKNMLVARFHIHNYGKAPAVVKALRVSHFRGPHHHNGRPPLPCVLPNDVLDVPNKDNFARFLHERGRMPLRGIGTEGALQPMERAEFVIAHGDRTDTLSMVGYGPLQPTKFIHPLIGTESYLIGTMFYEIPGQRSEVMNFCYKSNVRSGFDMFRDYAPYNERVKASSRE